MEPITAIVIGAIIFIVYWRDLEETNRLRKERWTAEEAAERKLKAEIEKDRRQSEARWKAMSPEEQVAFKQTEKEVLEAIKNGTF